jgi:hypothetical protein
LKNGISAKQQVVENTSRRKNGTWMKSQLTKWQTDRMANCQNCKLAKYQVIEIAD